MRILFDSKKIEYKKPFGVLKAGEKCTLTIKIPSSCLTRRVFVCLENDHTKEIVQAELKFLSKDDCYDSFSGEFSLNECGLYFYHFSISTEGSDFELFKEGNTTNIGIGEKWQLSCISPDFSVPESFQGKVMYQIFPDRFYRENVRCADGKLTPYWIHENTNDIPHYLPDEKGEVLNCDFFGGNLDGITKKLDYIKSLGTSIIYLNPIFKAYSNHRYDTCDYKTIDPLLGDESDFVHLCNEAHKRNIKIILDGVFSHTGSNSIYFDKNCIFGNGAYSCDCSPFKSWFNFGDSKNSYDSWWGIATLPCVNELSPDYMNYIINDDDSVIAHWLRLGADGFRLDVADELPDEFIQKLRARVKEIKPESFVVGEVWEDASNKISYSVRRKYFTASELDSVMNYVFKNAIIAFATGKMNASDFACEVMTIVENYPSQSLHSLMNSLSTHDTARILTCLADVPSDLSRDEMSHFVLSPEMRAKALSKLYVAALLQYTLPGTACIYYGDEIGMEGFGDPFNRGYFKWESADEGLFGFFAALGKLKNELTALQIGDICFERTDDVLIFERKHKGEIVTVVINKSLCEYEIFRTDALISHNVSIRDKKMYVQNGGFAVFERE